MLSPQRFGTFNCSGNASCNYFQHRHILDTVPHLGNTKIRPGGPYPRGVLLSIAVDVCFQMRKMCYGCRDNYVMEELWGK